jgi:transcriptional regulator with XRE-family HTH domain
MARGQETTGHPNAVGERIRRARNDRGLSQEALAERIGVTTQALESFESSDVDASRYLRRIAVATGKPVAYFAGTDVGRRRGLTQRVRAAASWLEEGSQHAPGEPAAPRDPSLEAREHALAERERELEVLQAQLGRERDEVERERDTARRELAAVAERSERRAGDLETKLAQREQELARAEHELAARAAVPEQAPPTTGNEQVEFLRAANEEAARQLDEAARATQAARSAADEAGAERDAVRVELAALRELREREAADFQRELEALRTELPRTVAAPAGRYSLETLEALVERSAASAPDGGEAWRAYIVFLRDFARADGSLPPSFDPLVEEVFGSLLGRG